MAIREAVSRSGSTDCFIMLALALQDVTFPLFHKRSRREIIRGGNINIGRHLAT
jgi:hypothetical protein